MFYQLGARVRAKSHIFAALIAFCAFRSQHFHNTGERRRGEGLRQAGQPDRSRDRLSALLHRVLVRRDHARQEVLREISPEGIENRFPGRPAGRDHRQRHAGRKGRCRLRRRHARDRIHQPSPTFATFASFRCSGWATTNATSFLVRTDAPQFQSSEEAISWLNGKTVAVPKGSCTDRFAQAVFKRFKIGPPSTSTRASRSSPAAFAPRSSMRP